MKIAVGSDHGGYGLKLGIIEHLKERGIEVEDLGCYSEESVDYPEYGVAVGEAVVNGKADRGIVCCGTGLGISMAANKVHGVRCAVPSNVFMAEMARRHNDANVLALGARVVGSGLALKIVDTFLDSSFDGGRHERRVRQMMNLEDTQ
jgi:ribose 5-phosphate isomerase B